MKEKSRIVAYLDNKKVSFNTIDKEKSILLGTNEYYPYGIRDVKSKLKVKEFYYKTKSKNEK